MYILSLFFGRGLPSSLFQTQQKLRQFFSFLCFSYEIYRRKVGEEQVTGGWTGSLSLAATRVLLSLFPFSPVYIQIPSEYVVWIKTA